LALKNRITGIILSGGKSIRMGENKAFIEIEGMPIIKRIHSLFERIFEEVIIVTNEEELYRNFNAKIYNDLFKNGGVIGGLYTGLFFSMLPYSFCVASDMPLLKESVIEYLVRNVEDYDVVVPRTKDGLQPLHAIYSKQCLEPIKIIIDQKKHRIIDLYKMVRTKIIDEFEFISLDPERESFVNINTPEELLQIKQGKYHN
jgi:molybdopterin-guanine dinucleotide biosynthesis protein A